jgi:ubiquinone/menaquinone biosynthesis C-methylase UbiE
LNDRSAKAILEESAALFRNSSVRANGLVLPFPDQTFDYVIQSSTLHHFDDAGAVNLLKEMARVARRGIFVIDLHRKQDGLFFLHDNWPSVPAQSADSRRRGAVHFESLPEDGRDRRRTGLANVKVEKHFRPINLSAVKPGEV